MPERKGFGGQPKEPAFTAFPSVLRSRTLDVPFTCDKGHPLAVDVPEEVIRVGRRGERIVPKGVTGTWKAWCDVCREGSFVTKRADERLIVQGERRDIPTTPAPDD